MVALALVRQRLQQVATGLGPKLASEVVLVIRELDAMASTRLGHALRLATRSFNSLSEKCRKEAVSKSWGNMTELIEMLNIKYPMLRLPVQG